VFPSQSSGYGGASKLISASTGGWSPRA